MPDNKIDVSRVGEALFDGVNSGKITMKEYKTAVAGWKVIKKVLQKLI